VGIQYELIYAMLMKTYQQTQVFLGYLDYGEDRPRERHQTPKGRGDRDLS